MCDKTCNTCNNCTKHEIEIVNNHGLFPHTRYVWGVKCNKNNNVAFTIFDLQNGIYQ